MVTSLTMALNGSYRIHSISSASHCHIVTSLSRVSTQNILASCTSIGIVTVAIQTCPWRESFASCDWITGTGTETGSIDQGRTSPVHWMRYRAFFHATLTILFLTYIVNTAYPFHPPPHHLGHPRTLYPTMKHWNWSILTLGLSFLVYLTLINFIQVVPPLFLSPIWTPTLAHVLYSTSSANSPSDSPFSTQASIPLPVAEDQRYCFSRVTHYLHLSNLHYPRYVLYHTPSNRWL